MFRRALEASLAGCRTVLDVGCGCASPLAAIGFAGTRLGVDISAPDLALARRAGTHDQLVRADVARIGDLVRPRSVDAVVALDVIEHLEREPALELVLALERIARRRVVVFTPNGFVPQPPTEDNPHQEHRSGFTVRDMRERGYRVRGIHGLWCLLGAFGETRFAPGFLWRRVADATAPLVYRAPRLAFSLLCVKDVDGRAPARAARRAAS
ncbi:MAG: class I SAM-dependent methyltransferase [Thermodesulfobacteriota bacterium]